MKFTRSAVFAAACLALAAPASADSSGVHIIYPPKLDPEPEVARTDATQAVKVKVYVVPRLRSFYKWRERRRVNRALFQNYPWQRTRYGGRLYPF